VRAGVVTGMAFRIVTSVSGKGELCTDQQSTRASAARDRDVDPGAPFGEQIPQNGCTEVAQNGAFSGREDAAEQPAWCTWCNRPARTPPGDSPVVEAQSVQL
jgi:hypothetical protein